MNAFLNFDNFITPKFISVLYWILLAVIVLSGLSFMFTSRLGFGGFLIGLGRVPNLKNTDKALF